MHLFKTVVVCVVVVAICGCDRSQPKPPVATSPTPPATTNNPTPVELPESANSIGMEFKLIAAVKFTMGSNDGSDRDKPAHQVTLTKPFKMGVHEVTQAQYEQVMKNNPSKFKGADHPVEMVSWTDAVEFCRRLSELPAEKAAGNVYRLPTEAEWEYACRAGTTTKFSFGNDEKILGDYAWYRENAYDIGEQYAHQVGLKKPNAFGLYDMHGNVRESCHDYYRRDYYKQSPEQDPSGPVSGSLRVLRGGSWDDNVKLVITRSAFRSWFGARLHSTDYGFRVVRELD